MEKARSKAFETTALPLFFCCQLATLGLLRQTPSYSLWEAEINAFPVFSLWIARILSVAVLFVALALALRGLRFLRLRTMLAANGAALLIGFILTFYYAYSLPVYFAAQCLIGIAHAWILLCWAEYLASLEKSHRNRSIAFAALLAVFIFTAMSMLPPEMRAVCFLAIACGSVLPLFLTPQDGGDNAEETSEGKALDARRSPCAHLRPHPRRHIGQRNCPSPYMAHSHVLHPLPRRPRANGACAHRVRGAYARVHARRCRPDSCGAQHPGCRRARRD